MMDKDTVNITIPVYNVERYLRKCLNSVRKQTYRNIAVILVDDGSKDKSPQICDEYVSKDSRFHVIHKTNGGPGSARNARLEYAVNQSGGIMFVDADDWLPKNAVEALVRRQNETKADYICGGFITINPVRNRKTVYADDCFNVGDDKFNVFLMQIDKRIHSSWCKLFKKQIIIKNNLRYHSELRTSQDCMFFYQYIQCCEKIATTSECVYYYNLLNSGSITHSYYPDRNVYKKTFLIERQKCFKHNISKDILYANNDVTLRIFNALMWRYTSMLPKNEALKKIQETYMLFKDLLDKITIEDDFDNQYTATKTYLKYKSFLETGKYNHVYDYFSTNSAVDNSLSERLKRLINYVMGKVRLFILFGF